MSGLREPGRRLRHRRPARGQAVIETIVAGIFVLVPLFLAISAIGKLANVQHTAEMAARYAAWERTVWYEDSAASPGFDKHNAPNKKSAAQIRSELGVRVLNDRSKEDVIQHGDKSANAFANGLDPMFADAAGMAYLGEYSQLASTQAMQSPDKTIVAGALGALEKVPEFGKLLPATPTDSLATTTVRLATVAKTSEVYKRLWPDPAWAGLDMQATGSILSNTWAANSREGVEHMVEDLMPARKDKKLNGLLGGLKGAISLWDPFAAEGIDIGRRTVDEVPPDRLK